MSDYLLRAELEKVAARQKKLEEVLAGQPREFSGRYALEEARRNLERKFPHALEALSTLHNGIHFVEHRADLGFPENLAKKERPIFQAALACRATHLLTGDLKDFGSFMNRPEHRFGICIQTVADFFNHLE